METDVVSRAELSSSFANVCGCVCFLSGWLHKKEEQAESRAFHCCYARSVPLTHLCEVRPEPNVYEHGLPILDKGKHVGWLTPHQLPRLVKVVEFGLHLLPRLHRPANRNASACSVRGHAFALTQTHCCSCPQCPRQSRLRNRDPTTGHGGPHAHSLTGNTVVHTGR